MWAKGRSGGFRLDVSINLISLGVAFQCPCHRERHAGNISHADMLAVVATRENTFQDHIERVVYLLRRLPKAPSPWEVAKEVEGMGAERELGLRVLRECNLLFEE